MNPRPNRVRRNIVANGIGRVWTILIGLGVLPLYVRFLGAEAYGLVGLYGVLVSICSLFDTGISASLGRELARAVAGDTGKRNAELVRTAEIIYGSLGVALGAVIVLVAPWIIDHWLNLRAIKPQVAISAVRLMGLYLIFQWPTGLYFAALVGLQKQVELNVLTLLGTSVRALGAVIVLWAVSRSILAFYVWQVGSTALYLFLSREMVWRAREVTRKAAAFRWRLIQDARGFAGGVTLMTGINVGVSQLDKIVLTRLVPLDAFGYYSFATTIAAAAAALGQPILTATYPAMIEAYTAQEQVRLAGLFHKSAQLVAVTTFAPSAVVCAFSYVVLRLWTRDATTASHTAALLSVCILGSALGSVALVPYNLTLAAGSVRASMIVAIVGMIVYAIVLAVLAPRIGVMSGAIGGTMVNAFGLLIYMPFISRLLPRQSMPYLLRDILLPMATAGGVAFAARAVFSGPAGLPSQAAGLAAVSFVTLALCIAGTRYVREEVVLRIRALRSPRPV
jgi:O-antigen/teichoic acid export membrane protein